VNPAEVQADSRERSSDPGELLAVALQSARMAGALLLERFESGVAEDVRSKSTPTDLVSDADFASQRAIRELLAELRPLDGFLGEEDAGEASARRPDTASNEDQGALARDTEVADGGGARSEEGEGEALRWVVDPLDGTVNFLFGIPQWCVSVAVQDASGSSLAGAVFDPCRDEMWAAARDAQAMLNGVAVSCSQRSELSTAMVATGLFYDAAVRARQARVLAELLPRVRDIRRFGSAALDLTWTAAGRYDAYFERGVKLWDVAAGALICERSGLQIVDLPEAPGDPGLPRGILAAPTALVDSLLPLVA
jgi:myo-inositol-1(or 4)-monophosphatase